jgi:uncharacterized integral membrane protein
VGTSSSGRTTEDDEGDRVNETTEQPNEHHRAQDAGRAIRWFISGVLLAALVALAVDNRHEVRVGWVIDQGDAPGWIVLVVAAAVGAIIGWLMAHRPRHRY